jgi:DUF4097 and DUF4098 domain-containing protein YvlB
MVLPAPHVPAPLQLRIATSSGRVTVTADDRVDVVVDRGEVGPTIDGVVEIRPQRGSSSVAVRCPEGADLVVGTGSGSVELHGRLGSVSVTSASGSIRVSEVTDADLRTTSGSVEIADCDDRCRVSTKSGKVTVEETGTADISTVSGTIRIERVTGAVQARTVSGGVSIVSDAQGPVTAQTVSGGVRVKLPAGVRPAVRVSGPHETECGCDQGDDLTVEVRTISGTVEITPV